MAPVDHTEAWERAKQRVPTGTRVQVVVSQHAAFGVFGSISGLPFPCLIQITDFKDGGRMTPAEYPPIGSTVDAVVLGFNDRNHEIWVGRRPSQLRE